MINSVVDDGFEKAVLTSCNALLSSGGQLITCTRNMASVEGNANKQKHFGNTRRAIYYLDDDNYSVSISNGVLFKQKFHTIDSYVKLLSEYFDDVSLIEMTTGYVYCIAKKPKALPKGQYRHYLNKEFNIEYPNGFYHNKHKGLVDILLKRVEERDDRGG